MQKLALAACAAAVVGVLATSTPADAKRFGGGGGRSFGGGGNFGHMSNWGGGGRYMNFNRGRNFGAWGGGGRYWNNWNGNRWGNRWSNWGGGRYWNNWNGGRYWNRGRYWNNWNYRPWGWGLGAGILGFAAGAALANSYDDNYVNQQVIVVDSNHVIRCQARYRSYNPQTDMFLGFDGQFHVCRL